MCAEHMIVGRAIHLGKEGQLYSTEQYQNKDDYKDQLQTAARIIAPACAIWPGRKGADDEHLSG
jgi:hypothetical protein